MSTHAIRDRWEVGVLVHTKGLLTKGEVRWVRILCRVWIHLETNTNVIRKQGDLFREKGDAVLFGERLRSQKWWIDGAVEPEATLESDTQDYTMTGQKRRRTLHDDKITAAIGKVYPPSSCRCLLLQFWITWQSWCPRQFWRIPPILAPCQYCPYTVVFGGKRRYALSWQVSALQSRNSRPVRVVQSYATHCAKIKDRGTSPASASALLF